MTADINQLTSGLGPSEVEYQIIQQPVTGASLGLYDWHMAFVPDDHSVVAIGFSEPASVGKRRELVVSPAIREIDMSFNVLRSVCRRHVHLVGESLEDDALIHLCELAGYPDVKLLSLMEATVQLFPTTGWMN